MRTYVYSSSTITTKGEVAVTISAISKADAINRLINYLVMDRKNIYPGMDQLALQQQLSKVRSEAFILMEPLRDNSIFVVFPS